MKVLIAMLAACAGISALAQAPGTLPCAETDKKCASAAALQSPVRKKSFWSGALARPLEQRVGPAPAELVTFITLDNIQSDIPNRPRAPKIADDLLAETKAALGELPPVIKALVEERLAGIYFVSDLGGTGYTDYANGGWFSHDAGFTLLDVDVLAKQTANAWATWKENTPFKADPAFRLEARIEDAAGDNRKNAIQYILLHELGHILSIGKDIHPRWDGPPSSVAGFPFARLSWEFVPAETRYASTFDKQFVLRREVVYYFGARLGGRQMFDAYHQVADTNFPTLYAATHPGDDFAESFASYVHTVMMKRPWEIRLYQDGKLVRTVGSCWEEERCAEKRRILEEILGIKPSETSYQVIRQFQDERLPVESVRYVR